MVRRHSPGRRPALPGPVQKDKVAFIMRHKNATLLGGDEQVLVVCIPFLSKLAHRHGSMPRISQEFGDLQGDVIVQVEVGQWNG